MSAATLASLQGALAEIYDLPATPDVAQFLLTDRAHLAQVQARASDEQLIVAEEGDTLSMALYIDAAVLTRLARRDPFCALTQDNLADYLTVAEGVSHFVYVAWNAGFDKPVTLLELELQAEVDKYVLVRLAAARAGRGPVSARVASCAVRAHAHRSVRGRGPGGPVPRRLGVREADSAAGWPHASRCGTHVATRELLAELRRFYRWGSARKLRHIDRFA